MTRKTAQQIDAEAADWAARIDRGPLEPEQDARFQAWMRADVRCAGAYGRVRAIALTSERARALGTNFDPSDFAPPPARRTLLWGGGALAASALLALAGAWQVLHERGRYSTGKGESKVVTLHDGSVVTLNTESEIRVAYSDTQRGVELIAGEALFDVAKNRALPFVVTAGETTVRVVGTSFTVRRLEDTPVEVLVREGIVEVFKPQTGIAPVRITANTMAVAPLGGAAGITARALPVAQVDRQMAWKNGQIAFEGETLAQAVQEFARYSDTRIVIDDPALGREEIAGLFRATDPVGFARTVAISLNARVEVGKGEVRLAR